MSTSQSESYASPAILASFATRELIEDAVACQTYQPPVASDAALKEDVEAIRQPLGGLSQIETGR